MTINAELRTSDFGSAGSRRLLRAGRIPAVIYGKSEPVHITINARDFNYNEKKYRKDENLIVSVNGGKEYKVVIKEIQDDLLRNVIHHVDFFEV